MLLPSDEGRSRTRGRSIECPLEVDRIGRVHLGKGVPIKEIARELKVSRNTVCKVVRSDAKQRDSE